MVCVANDICHCVDEKKAVLLVLLNLLAAFDTADHNILLDHVVKQLAIQDTSLSWFQSYLSERCQAVRIDGCVSEGMSLLCGVPQGSVLGPLVFSIYSEPICDITHKHDIKIHSYADDTVVFAV